MSTAYELGLCVGQDPDEWSEPTITGRAMALCARCPIRQGCLTDARTEQARGVLRGGHHFRDHPERVGTWTPSVGVCPGCDRPMVGRTVRPPPGYVRINSRGMCARCYDQLRETGRVAPVAATDPTNRSGCATPDTPSPKQPTVSDGTAAASTSSWSAPARRATHVGPVTRRDHHTHH